MDLRARARRIAIPVGIFALTAIVYVVVAGPRTEGPAPDNHFAHLAESWLAGQLDVVGGRPPGYNDWACVDSESMAACAGDAHQRPRSSYRWYVSFPPFPAVLLLPMVALFGRDFSDPLFWAIFAGLAPAFLFVLLRRLREDRISERTPKEELLLVTVFAFGSVYFVTAVHGSVWFAAHIVDSLLLVLFFLFAIGARRPLLAGIALGLSFWTRPTTAIFALFFLLEAIRVSREAMRARAESPPSEEPTKEPSAPRPELEVLQRCLLFAAPILMVGGLAMWMNHARFGDPFSFGHTFLVIRWRPRIDKWGLFNFHYLSKNLAVFAASLPWLSAVTPFVKISRHGLALWVTSPNLLWVLWPKGKVTALMRNLFIPVALIAIFDLCYQNSGWVQFGYRFSLDYMPALIVLLALGRRRFGWGFVTALVLAIAINLFGAITFDRVPMFYDDDGTQERLFQPD